MILWSFMDSASPALLQHPGDFVCAACADIIFCSANISYKLCAYVSVRKQSLPVRI